MKNNGERLRARNLILLVVFLLVIVLVLYVFLQPARNVSEIRQPGEAVRNVSVNSTSVRSITLASWNLQAFGQHKASNATLLEAYARVLGAYDIAFVQEIRDETGSAFPALCARIPTHNCINSSRAGRSSNKEQIGIIYRKNIKLVGFRDFNPDPKDRWERHPIEVDFETDGYQLRVYNIHTAPDSVPTELAALEPIVNASENTVVLGDLNADCGYYPKNNRTHFKNWTWVIPEGADTTVHATNCAYDRILLNGNATSEFVDYGIYKTGINTTISDHYLVWVNLSERDN